MASVAKTTHRRGITKTSGRDARASNRIRSWSVSSYLLVIVLMVASLTMVSCGQFGDSNANGTAGDSETGETSSSVKQPLTVEEYAEGCSGKMITDFDTVYDLVDFLK